MGNSELVHGVFNSPEQILESFKERCSQKGIDFGGFSWITSEQPPAFTADKDVVVVLDVTLDRIDTTFEFVWEWMKEKFERIERSSELDEGKITQYSSDSSHLSSNFKFRPWTLAWRRIKLNKYRGRKPEDVCAINSPGCALLFVAAQHPERIRTIGYQKRCDFFIPGLDCAVRRCWHDVEEEERTERYSVLRSGICHSILWLGVNDDGVVCLENGGPEGDDTSTPVFLDDEGHLIRERVKDLPPPPPPPPLYEERAGVFYLSPSLSVTSNGLNGREWNSILSDELRNGRGVKLTNLAKMALLSPDFNPSKGLTTRLAVIRSNEHFCYAFARERNGLPVPIVANVYAEAKKLGLVVPRVEVACLVYQLMIERKFPVLPGELRAFVVMSEPIFFDPYEGSGTRFEGTLCPHLFMISSGELTVTDGHPEYLCGGNNASDAGFVFAVPD